MLVNHPAVERSRKTVSQKTSQPPQIQRGGSMAIALKSMSCSFLIVASSVGLLSSVFLSSMVVCMPTTHDDRTTGSAAAVQHSSANIVQPPSSHFIADSQDSLSNPVDPAASQRDRRDTSSSLEDKQLGIPRLDLTAFDFDDVVRNNGKNNNNNNGAIEQRPIRANLGKKLDSRNCDGFRDEMFSLGKKFGSNSWYRSPDSTIRRLNYHLMNNQNNRLRFGINNVDVPEEAVFLRPVAGAAAWNN